MSENIFKAPNGGTVVINGGDPLPGCPTSFEDANAWADAANGKKYDGNEFVDKPVWKWDCGFKLDYDGPLLRVSSRFYPPKSDYGPNWDGTVSLLFKDQEISEKEFNAETLEELRKQVEDYVAQVEIKLFSLFETLKSI